jgi:hypothetical protein
LAAHLAPRAQRRGGRRHRRSLALHEACRPAECQREGANILITVGEDDRNLHVVALHRAREAQPKLQTSGGLCYFLHDYLRYPVPSPALLKPRHDHFIAAVQQFAERYRIPTVPFEPGESKDARVARYRARFRAPEGVVVLGVAQEKMRSFKAHKRPGHGHTPVFDFSRQSVAVNHYYFYVQDRDWGPAFLKIGTYLPYPVKLCLNGHEWVKQWLRRHRIRFEPR